MRTEPLTDARIRKIPVSSQEQNIRDSKCLFLRVPSGKPGARCELNRSMQHLSLKMKAEDVAYGQAPTTKILL
jgi:hypothetical protein